MAFVDRGIIKLRLKDTIGALNDFNKALEINPKFSPAYYCRGKLNVDNQDSAGAMKDLNKLSELEPKSFYTFLLVGIEKRRLKNFTG